MSDRISINPRTGFINNFLDSTRSNRKQPGEYNANRFSDNQAVRLNIRGRNDDLDVVYAKPNNKPKPAQVEPQTEPVLKPTGKPVSAKPVASDVPDLSKLGANGVYKRNEDGSTTVDFGGFNFTISKDGQVKGQVNAPGGNTLAINGKYSEGKLDVQVDKLGRFTGDINFTASPEDGNPAIDGTTQLTNVKLVKPTETPNLVTKGLYKNSKDGSKVLEFGGFSLTIDSKGKVSGELRAPNGETLKIEGKYRDGKLDVEVQKLGRFTGQVKFTEGSDNKLADGEVDLTNVRQLSGPKEPKPDAPKLPEKIKGVQVGNKSYFDGFSLTEGEKGELSVEVNTPDGKVVKGTGKINEKGELVVTLSDPGGALDGQTYSAKLSKEGKDGGVAVLSDIKFLGIKSPELD